MTWTSSTKVVYCCILFVVTFHSLKHIGFLYIFTVLHSLSLVFTAETVHRGFLFVH